MVNIIVHSRCTEILNNNNYACSQKNVRLEMLEERNLILITLHNRTYFIEFLFLYRSKGISRIVQKNAAEVLKNVKQFNTRLTTTSRTLFLLDSGVHRHINSH